MVFKLFCSEEGLSSPSETGERRLPGTGFVGLSQEKALRHPFLFFALLRRLAQTWDSPS